jgi:peroxiredoxin
MNRQVSRFLIFAGVGLCVVMISFLYIRSKLGQGPGPVAPQVGFTAPDFTLQNLSGQSIRLGDLRGHTVLINFWATWCNYCLQEMPTIEKYYERYFSNLVVLGVEVGDSAEEVRAFVTKNGFKFNILRDPDSRVFEKYRLDSFPVTFLVDPKGTVLIKHLGYMSEKKLIEYLSVAGITK